MSLVVMVALVLTLLGLSSCGAEGLSSLSDEVLLTWYAPVLSNSGYGKEAVEYITAMDRMLTRAKSKCSPEGGKGAHDDCLVKAHVAKVSTLSENIVEISSIGTMNHGDQESMAVFLGFDESTRRRLDFMLQVGHTAHSYGVVESDSEDAHMSLRYLRDPTMPLGATDAGKLFVASVVVCHSEPGAWSVPMPLYETSTCPPWHASISIGRTMFETDRIPTGWVARIHAMTEVWVPTEFHRQTFIRSGVRPEKLVVIPESIDTRATWNPNRCLSPSGTVSPSNLLFRSIHQSRVLSKCTFRFLSVFKWEERKGWDVLLSAFYEEFIAQADLKIRDEDDAQGLVCLLLKTSAYHSDVDEGDDDEYDEQVSAFLRNKYGKSFRSRRLKGNVDSNRRKAVDWPQIHVVSSTIDSDVYPVLYCAVDCLVQPSRGEGWGRPHMEAMAMGVPVIATNWSGNTAFMTNQNSFLLSIEDELTVIQSGAFAGHKWAEPSKAHLRELMRRVVRMKQGEGISALRQLSDRARHDIETLYDNEIVAAHMLQRVLTLAGNLTAAKAESSHQDL